MKIRLHQFLSKCGEFTSKRKIKEAIWNGEILVNNSIVKDIKFNLIQIQKLYLIMVRY